MNDEIPFTYLNDFIFCPISVYFHSFDLDSETTLYQSVNQLNGKAAHEAIDNRRYSTRTSVLQARSVYCEKYNLVGKIDIFDTSNGILIERKKKVVNIYDGYIFQVYAQFFALSEMGYEVKSIRIYSMDDNKTYPIRKPEDDPDMLLKFEQTINDMKTFDMENYIQTNAEKCRRCVYEPACDRSLL